VRLPWPFSWVKIMLIPLVLALLSTVSAADPAQNDARLHDLCFVDAQHGWAVGDRGVIWNTSDGGRVWRLQPSGVSCPLEGVWFLGEQLGWAVGGFSRIRLRTPAPASY